MTDDQDDPVSDAWSTDEVAARTQAFTDLVLVGEDVKDNEIKTWHHREEKRVAYTRFQAPRHISQTLGVRYAVQPSRWSRTGFYQCQ